MSRTFRWRALLFWLHLGFGVVVGLFIANMAISGILIAYQDQILSLLENRWHTVPIPPDAHPLDLETVLNKIHQERPNTLMTGLTLYSDPASAILFNAGPNGDVFYVNPYSGAVQGEGAQAARRFFTNVTSWHRWLALEGTARPIGKTITGTVAVVYLVLLVSGLCLWLPRQWKKIHFRPRLSFNLRLKGRARDWNWHHVIGFWCAPILLTVALTGTLMSFHWANNLLYRLTGSPLPESRRETNRPGNEQSSKPSWNGLNGLRAQAEQRVPGWNSINLRFSPNPTGPITFRIDRGEGHRPDLISQLVLDRKTGQVRRWEPFASQNNGQKLRSWVRPIHTGEAGGWWGETIAVGAALGATLMVWTGLSLAYRRFFVRRLSRTTSAEQSTSIAP